MSLLFPGSIEGAIAHCRKHSSLFIVLARPAVIHTPAPDETPSAKYSRVADTSLSKHTLSSPLVRAAVNKANAAFIQVRHGTPEFAKFAETFSVDRLPCLFIIAPGEKGAVLVKKEGFVSPAAFVGSLNYAQTAQGKPREALLATTIALVTEATKHAPSASASDSNPEISSTALKENLLQARSASEDPSKGAKSQTTVTATTPSQKPKQQITQERIVEPPPQCSFAIRYPNGNVDRVTFPSKAPFSVVRQHVSTKTRGRFQISSPFPRRTFDAADDAKGLVELDLAPSATLVVSKMRRENRLIRSRGGRKGVMGIADAIWSMLVGVWMWIKGYLTRGGANGGEEIGRRARDGRRGRRPEQVSTVRTMSELRRMQGDSEKGRNSYWNGNSTQFGSNDDGRKNG